MNAEGNYVDDFEAKVKSMFSFLETQFGFRLAGSTQTQGDFRDVSLVTKYRRGEQRIDIGWSPGALSLGILIRVDNDELARQEKCIHLEPFIQFYSEGKCTPIVPQIYPGMSAQRIEVVMALREERFAETIEPALSTLANRLQLYLETVLSSSATMIKAYHTWYRLQGRATSL